MIHLFANDRYGGPFVDAATQLRGGPAVTVVRSALGSTRPPVAGRLANRARRTIGRRLREITVPDINSSAFVERIGPADHVIVAGFNQIFGDPDIDRFATLVNFHPSLLPFYRGPVPSHWCLVEGETSTGFTLHEITPAIDAGPVLFQGTVDIPPGVTPADLDLLIARAAVPVFVRWLRHLADGTSWERTTVDASAVYRNHIGYRSFPPARGA